MVAEVSGASATNQTVQTRATEEAQTQTTRRASNNQPREGVEVRISQRQVESAPALRISPTRTFVQETGRHLKRNEALNLERRK